MPRWLGLAPAHSRNCRAESLSQSILETSAPLSMAVEKGAKTAVVWLLFTLPLSLLEGVFSQNGPQRSRARRCCAAKRTLHGEDRSEILDKRERGGPKWTAKMAQSLTASDIMDEKSVESRSQQTGSFLVAAAGQDAVDRRVAGDRDPQPPGVSSHFPARFVHGHAGTHPDLADEILVGRFALFSQARQSLAQPAGCQGQAKSLVQNGRGFAQGHPQFFVQDGRQRQGFRTHLRGVRSQGVGGLAGITSLDSFATFRAVADLDMKTGHPCLAHDLGLILVLHVPALHGTAATGATLWQRNLNFLIHDRGNRAMALTAVADSGLSTGASRIGLRLALGERCSLTLRRPSREIEFVLQPVALLPKFLFFLLDEFLFMPKLFVLRR